MNISAKKLGCGRILAVSTTAIAAAAILFVVASGRSMAAEAGVGNDVKYLPDDCDVVVSGDVNGIATSSAGQKIKTGLGDMLEAVKSKIPKDSKIKAEDVGRVTFGVSVQGKKGAGVIHMTRAVSSQDFPDIEKATKKTVGQYQLYIQDGGGFCMVDDRTVVVGDEESLGKVLERNAPANLGDGLKGAMGEVDFSKSFAVAVDMKNILGAARGAAPPGVDGIRGVGIQAEFADDLRLKAVAICKDAMTADQLKQMADGVVAAMKGNTAQMPPDAVKLLNAIQLSKSGSSILAGLTVDADTIVSLAKTAAKGAGGPGGPPTP